MPRKDELHIANLAFLLDYDDGTTDDEISYEIFKVAFQDKETIHYDRDIGGNFRDLEQEPANLSVVLWFVSNLIQSIYTVNEEKNNDPYIVVGFDDIRVEMDFSNNNSQVLTEINYKLLNDLNKKGTVKI
ncbi:MAG: hypothetical protein ACFFG0_02510 [Candidatus Thorarchaeota archaeon]